MNARLHKSFIRKPKIALVTGPFAKSERKKASINRWKPFSFFQDVSPPWGLITLLVCQAYISSKTIAAVRVSPPPPPSSAGMDDPNRPALPAASHTWQHIYQGTMYRKVQKSNLILLIIPDIIQMSCSCLSWVKDIGKPAASPDRWRLIDHCICVKKETGISIDTLSTLALQKWYWLSIVKLRDPLKLLLFCFICIHKKNILVYK